MAYEAVVTTTRETWGGRREFAVSIEESDAATASEWSVGGLPQHVTIISYRATLGTGGGATIDPIIGRATAPAASTQNHIWSNGAAVAHVEDTTLRRVYLPTGTIYGRSTVDAGADNDISTEILVREGWDA